jgi:hypothetical protein
MEAVLDIDTLLDTSSHWKTSWHQGRMSLIEKEFPFKHLVQVILLVSKMNLSFSVLSWLSEFNLSRTR